MPLSPSIYVMRLRHAAVLMKAGSYVMRPVSSSPALICFRSVARIAPSLIAMSYCLPVRLSVIVSVSAINRRYERSDESVGPGVVVRIRHRIAGGTIVAIRPPRQVFVPAPLAAERPPSGVYRMLTAQDAQRSLAHPTYSNQESGVRGQESGVRSQGSGVRS